MSPTTCWRSFQVTSGFAWANSRNSQNGISHSSRSVRAVTVALRRPSLTSASSPKWSPAPTVFTSLPPTLTTASPSAITKNPTPLISPSLTTTVPALTLRSRKCFASRRSCRFSSPAKSGTSLRSSGVAVVIALRALRGLLVRPLPALVALELLGRGDVAEGRMRRGEPLRGLHAVLLREHGAERLDLHLTEPGQRPDSPLQVGRVDGVAPDARRVPAVLGRDDVRELLHPLRHRRGKAVDRRRRREHLLQIELRELLR